MNLVKNNLTIRNAMPSDAEQLCTWWNDGKIMAHAGFPNGLNEQPDETREDLATDTDETFRNHIIEFDGKPIGEMSYRNIGNKAAEIGIKICDTSHQEKGLGTALLSMFIDALFTYYGYEKIVLDTNVKNKRAQHVYENKLGFKMVQVRENAWRDQLGELQSSIDYELTKKDWLAHTQKPPEYIHIRQERPSPDEQYAVEELTREAFWDGNWDMKPSICNTHLLVHKLRQCPSYMPELNFIAEIDGKLVGHIIYTKGKIVNDGGNAHEMLTFGPLSILPAYQNKGIGKALMHYTFTVAKELGYRAVFVFGHPDYYPRVGFRRAAEFGVSTSSGANFDPFMVYPLYDGALDSIHGRFYIDPVYDEIDDVTEADLSAFDKKFSPKELHNPISISVLLERLAPPARKALEGLKESSLKIMTTKSERELLAMEGIDQSVIETICMVMKENALKWGMANANR